MSSAVQLLLEDPDLGTGLDATRLATAEREVRALIMLVPRGTWQESQWPENLHHGPGLLVLDGTFIRMRGVEGRSSGELLGPGDILRPWQPEDSTIDELAQWRALSRARMAVLDVDFVRRITPYPEIIGELMARMMRRSRNLAINIAILHQPRVDTRLRMLLWHLSERWGVVRTDGVHVPLPLTHEVLAALVAARRPTVSTALGDLARSGSVERTSDGWLLRGSVPGELAEIATPLQPH